jgi:hypothetical protein
MINLNFSGQKYFSENEMKMTLVKRERDYYQNDFRKKMLFQKLFFIPTVAVIFLSFIHSVKIFKKIRVCS